MKDSSASIWGYVFTVLSAGSGLLAVVSIPVAGTGAPLVVGSLSLVLAVVAALFSERVSGGRFTSLGAFLAVAIAAVAILLLFALGRVTWSQGPSESLDKGRLGATLSLFGMDNAGPLPGWVVGDLVRDYRGSIRCHGWKALSGFVTLMCN